MTSTEFVFDPENKVDPKHGFYMFIGSLLTFGILNIIVTIIGPPKSAKNDSWRWSNVFVSWIHGAVCGVWVILCLYYYPDMLDDLVHHINYYTYLMVAFSTGYFVYDFLDLLLKGHLMSNWEVSLHHVAVASMFWWNVHNRMCIGYNTLALMAEINSFFLHSRKLLHMLHFEFNNKFYRGVCMVNLLTFFFCRGWSLCRISYGICTDYHLVPVVYYCCLCASIFVMNVINPVLFWRLLRNDILRHLFVKKVSLKDEQLVNGNNNQNTHIKSS